MVACSGYRDQFSACYQAFDGDHTSRSAWVTQSIGSPNPLTDSLTHFLHKLTLSLSFNWFAHRNPNSHPTGSKNTLLTTPQWILLDLGEGFRTYSPLSAVRVVCGLTENQTVAMAPKGCPKSFSLQGSSDNIKFETLYKVDLTPFSSSTNNTYDSLASKYGYTEKGQVFNIYWESSTGRETGHRCGSCDSGPSFSCNLQVSVRVGVGVKIGLHC
jgi:hypothetical protein